MVISIFFFVITFTRHAFEAFRLVFCFFPEGETDHLTDVGFPPGFPAFRFFLVIAAFWPLDILEAVAFGRHAGYFLLEFLADLRPQGFPVDTSTQSSLNHFFKPPLYAIYFNFSLIDLSVSFSVGSSFSRGLYTH